MKAHVSYSLQKLKGSGRWGPGSRSCSSNYLEEPEADVNVTHMREQETGMKPLS